MWQLKTTLITAVVGALGTEQIFTTNPRKAKSNRNAEKRTNNHNAYSEKNVFNINQ